MGRFIFLDGPADTVRIVGFSTASEKNDLKRVRLLAVVPIFYTYGGI